MIRKAFRALLRSLRPPRSLRFTRLGTYVVLLALGLGLAAMNTGNNLVYMIFGMLLGFITASGILSEMSLRGIEADWMLPSAIHAGKPAFARLLLKNTKKKMPSFGLEAELICLDSRGGFASLKGYFLYIAAQSQEFADAAWTPPFRGPLRIQEIKIETRFPFGFFRKYLLRPADQEILIYPALTPVHNSAPDQSSPEKNRALPQKGWGESLWEIREFFAGDNPRRISWKSSAKQAKLMVMETEKETDKKILIELGDLRTWRKLDPTELEEAVSFVASLAHKKLEEGYAVGFLAEGLRLEPSLSRKNLSEIFSYLARFDPRQAGENIVEDRKAMREEGLKALSLWQKENDAAKPG